MMTRDQSPGPTASSAGQAGQIGEYEGMDSRVGSRRRRALSGQSVVEFSLVSLVLLLIVFGTIDLGRAVLGRSMLTNAVREAARYGSIYPTDGVGYPNTSNIVAAAQRRSPSMSLS